jgi:hypothetical protein
MTGGVEQGMVSTGKRFGSLRAKIFAQLENDCNFILLSIPFHYVEIKPPFFRASGFPQTLESKVPSGQIRSA